MPDYRGGNPEIQVAIRGMNAAQAALRQFDVQMTEEILATTIDFGRQGVALIELLAPFDTGFMSQHAEYQLSPNGYAVQIGYFADTFLEQLASWGLRPRFYPPYQEYGTVHHGAQPSVGPAFEELAPQYLAAIKEIIQRSVSGYGVTQ